MGQIEKQLLEDFKKSNKERKEKLAKKFGYDSAEEYLKELETSLFGEVPKSTVVMEKVVKEKKTKVKPTVHIVNLLDNSGSMQGNKFDNAYMAIKQEVRDLNENTTAKYMYSLYNFGTMDTPAKSVDYLPIAEVTVPAISTNFNTPLYATIGLLANDIIARLSSNEKVLVKIFTDGENNCQSNLEANAIAAISDLQRRGVTVTFVGTKYDVSRIQTTFGIDKSNTLIHDNTGKGVEEAFEKTRGATITYTKNVVAGKDVSKGFYKNIK